MAITAQLCVKHGGKSVWPFSQSSFAVIKHTFSNPKTRWGICAALSAHWIAAHANSGSLATLLGGGGLGSINKDRLLEIIDLHSKASQQDDAVSQAEAIGEWLEGQRIVPVQSQNIVESNLPKFLKHHPQGWAARHHTKGRSEYLPTRYEAMGQELMSEMRQHSNCYLRVNFFGTCMGFAAGHAIAVFIGQKTNTSDGDAIMFDPNFGEYWFESKENFFEFFPEFFNAQYMNATQSFNQGIDVWPCNPLA